MAKYGETQIKTFRSWQEADSFIRSLPDGTKLLNKRGPEMFVSRVNGEKLYDVRFKLPVIQNPPKGKWIKTKAIKINRDGSIDIKK